MKVGQAYASDVYTSLAVCDLFFCVYDHWYWSTAKVNRRSFRVCAADDLKISPKILKIESSV